MAALFSMPTPEAIRQNARNNLRKEATLFAQVPAGRGFVASAGQSGALFGEALGRSQGGVSAGEADAMKFQQVQQAVTQKYADADLSDPKVQIQMLGDSASLFGKAGLSQPQGEAINALNGIRKSFSETQKTKRKDDSGFIVSKANPSKVISSASRSSLDNSVTADVTGDPMTEDQMFVRGDSPLANKLKAQTNASKRKDAFDTVNLQSILKSQKKERELINEQADVSSSYIDSLTSLDQQIENAEVGGVLEPIAASLGNMAQSLGVEALVPKNINDVYDIRRQFSLIALKRTALLKGAISKIELEKVIEAVGNISNPKIAMQMAVKAEKETANRSIQRKIMLDDYSKRNNGDISGFAKAFEKYRKQTPLIKIIKMSDGKKAIAYYSEAFDKFNSDTLNMAKGIEVKEDRDKFIKDRASEFKTLWSK